MNLGFNENLALPQIQINLDTDLELVLGSKGMNAPNGCSFFIIGEEMETENFGNWKIEPKSNYSFVST